MGLHVAAQTGGLSYGCTYLFLCTTQLVLSNSGSHTPPAIHRSSHPPPSRHIAEHRSSIAHNVRYIAIATWEDWIVGGLKV